ncbi:MAG: aminotransferase class I/II-fold pyridoxal phosphate-dependent enzyme [Pirellulales bacterium]|nr:aminotransferase class I/II-fold pyridoxal phosphate-dependent enzyme [Pirellulales bacterium]
MNPFDTMQWFGTPMRQEIDLRSDTVTRPTAAMRKAIAEAEVGDAVIDVDPTVDRLERMTAELLGKESAVFMPSGSMTNQIAIRVHCERGTEFICEADAHIFHYEQAAYAQLSGLAVQTVAGQQGVLSVDQLRDKVRPENEHVPRTRLVCLENTHNRWGGRIQPQQEVERICLWAAENGLKRHLDGARLWNAAVAQNKSEAELAASFDSVSVCFSKGLGAPVGSALAGSEQFIDEARRARKLFGGAMRQAGILAAAAIHALENHRAHLADDHAAAQALAEAAQQSGSLQIRGGQVQTNIVVLEVEPSFATAEQLVGKLEEQGVRCFAIGRQAIRFVTHRDVDPRQIADACEILRTLASQPVLAV